MDMWWSLMRRHLSNCSPLSAEMEPIGGAGQGRAPGLPRAEALRGQESLGDPAVDHVGQGQGRGVLAQIAR